MQTCCRIHAIGETRPAAVVRITRETLNFLAVASRGCEGLPSTGTGSASGTLQRSGIFRRSHERFRSFAWQLCGTDARSGRKSRFSGFLRIAREKASTTR
jgi:hypothetical protein